MKRKSQISIFAILLLTGMAGPSPAQNYKCNWLHRLENTTTAQNKTVTDHSGNIYTVGYFVGTEDFDPGNAVYNLISAGMADIFITKWSPAGNFIWAKRIGGPNSDYCGIAAIDDGANLIFIFSFSGTVDFDPDSGTYFLSSPINENIVAKFDSSGKLLWADELIQSSASPIASIATDPFRNIFISGHLGSNMDFDPGPGVYTLTYPAGNSFIAKYDSAGNFIWAKLITTSGQFNYKSIAADFAGNVCMAGSFTGTADFNPGIGTYNKTAGTSSDIYILKLDSSGSFTWAKTMTGMYASEATSLAIDGSANVYTTGSFRHSVDFDPGTGTFSLTSSGDADVFVCKLSNSGNLVWVKALSGPDGEFGNDIAVDRYGSVYTAGTFYGTTDFDPGAGIHNLTAAGSVSYEGDIFFSKLDSTGDFITTIRIYGNYAERYPRLAALKSGDSYLTGMFDSNTLHIFGKSLPNTSNGLQPFLSRLSCTSSSMVNINACHSYNSPSGKYTWTQTGIYNDTIPNVSGCDSNINIILVIDTVNTSSNVTISTCYYYDAPSGNYTWTSSGIYHDTIPNAANCDSLLTINLTIDTSTYAMLADTGCNLYTSPSGNHTWTTAGIYSDTISNAAGCDSILTINLFLFKNYSVIFDTACNQYISPSGNYLWNASGVYNDTLTNTAGCDSIISLNLYLKHTYSTINAIGCYQYISPSGNYTWTSSGTYNDTIMNAASCDSIITIHLLFKNNSSTQNIVTCYSYTAPSGNYTWYASGTYKDTVLNVFGCDSVITYQVTIKQVDTTVIQSGTILIGPPIAATFQWLDCNNGFSPIPGATSYSYSPPVDGSYALEVTYTGCKDTSACYPVVGVGIANLQQEDRVEALPNPVVDQCTIKLGKLAPAVISINDLYGNEVFPLTICHKRKITLDLHFLNDGIYFVNIRNEHATRKLKIVIASH